MLCCVFCFLSFCGRKTWKPPNTFAGCVWPDSSFIKLTRAACKLLGFSFLHILPCSRLFVQGVYVRVSPPLVCHLTFSTPLPLPLFSSERSVTLCLLKAPRSPFSLCPFPAFQCSLVPLCLLIRGEQHRQATACSAKCRPSALQQMLSGVLTHINPLQLFCVVFLDTHRRCLLVKSLISYLWFQSAASGWQILFL